MNCADQRIRHVLFSPGCETDLAAGAGGHIRNTNEYVAMGLIRLIILRSREWLPVGAIVVLCWQIALLCGASALLKDSGAQSKQALDYLTGCAAVSMVSAVTFMGALYAVHSREKRLKGEVLACLSRLNISDSPTPVVSGRNHDVESNIRALVMAADAVHEREKAIADHSLDFLCALDVNKQIVAVNQASFRLTGLHFYQLIEKDASALIDSADLDLFYQALSRAANVTASVEVVTAVETVDVEPRIFLWTIDFSTTHQLYFCAGKDVTAKMQLERFKQDFTSMVVHDLRSPISSAAMTMQSLLQDKKNAVCDSHKVQLSRTLSAMERLLRLIGSLLDLNKLEAGKFKLNIQLVRIAKLVDESLATIRSFADQKQVVITASGDLQEKVAVDEEKMIQVLINLLSNAVKYSPTAGTIALTVHQSEKMITVIVSDEGPGVPEASKGRIFERYEQVAVSEQSGSTGLGLFICKAIVERHGGNIGVRSEVGKGSQFWFTMPALTNEPDPELDL